MIVSALAVNVGRSGGNRSLCFSLFCRVSLFFIFEVPVGSDGMVLAHEERDVELISFVVGSGVAVYARRDAVALFEVFGHTDSVGVIGFMGNNGVMWKFGGVYIPPRVSGPGLLDALSCAHEWDVVAGDFNARHPRCGKDVGDTTCYGSGSALARYMDDHRFVMCPVDGATYRDVSVLDLCWSKGASGLLSHRFVDLAGLDHKAQLMRLECVAPAGMVGDNISWRMVDWADVKEKVEATIARDGGLRWDAIRCVVGGLRKAKRRKMMPGWWNPGLAAMRADVRRLRNSGPKEDYCLARKVYRSTLADARNEALGQTYQDSKDPDIFRMIDRLDVRRTLPPMLKDDGSYATKHADIADMIVGQLGPCSESVLDTAPVPTGIDALSEADIVGALSSGPVDTSPGFDAITYPFLRWLHKRFPSEFDELVTDTLEHDHPDFHVGEVVLIQKSAKPTYDIVKSWRMIALLPTFSKLLERIVLAKLVKCLDLEPTQFGSRQKRGVHDAMACALGFLEECKGMKRLLVSMDVEGGFDKLDRGLLLDFLVARGARPDLTAWIARWCESRVLRVRLNGRISRDYHVQRGVPQGSPLSPFLFGAYVADVMTPRLRYGPSVRLIVISYVDDTVIAVAADSGSLAKYVATDVFEDCYAKAAARHRGFSRMKTEWIGFDDQSWGDLTLGDNRIQSVDVIWILGYRINRHLNWSAHVDSWLKRGLWVRNRISAISRRFGDRGGAGAWETYTLFQGVYLMTVYFGLEFVGDYSGYVKRIHTGSCQ